jgi:hypothetical protein
MSIIYGLLLGYPIGFGLWILFIPIIFMLAAINFHNFLFGWLIKKSCDGWRKRLKIILILVVLMDCTNYVDEAYIRTNLGEATCGTSISPDEVYFGKACYFSENTRKNYTRIWVMIYDKKTMKLLKEGNSKMELDELHWNIDENGKTIAAYTDLRHPDLKIKLPPSWLDTLRAKLP